MNIELLEAQILTPMALVQRKGQPSVWVKLEYLNPSGSTKDRIARFILTKALRDGRLKQGDLVIEASSGSTSISMAMYCARLGLKFMAVVPPVTAEERLLMIRAYGGQVHKAAPDSGIADCIALSRQLAAGREDVFLPDQFANPDNATAHRLGTAREAIEQLPFGRCDAVVAGVGTGGTLYGIYQGLRDFGNNPLAVLAKPVSNVSASGFSCGCFNEPECSFSSKVPGVVEGLSKLCKPEDFDHFALEEVCENEAIAATRELIGMGFAVGVSSGLNLVAAERIATKLGGKAQVLSVFCDRMERYFSTELFNCYRESCQG